LKCSDRGRGGGWVGEAGVFDEAVDGV